MDSEDARPLPGTENSELESRAPLEADLVKVCRSLNGLGARYIVIGGFAIIYAGLPRTTGDVDLLIATDPENEALVYRALEVLPDRAVRELSNFGVWLVGVDAGLAMYPMTFGGLVTCFEMAIPFFTKSLSSDITFGTGFILVATRLLVVRPLVIAVQSNGR